MEVDIIELYSSFIKPVLPFTYVAVLILVAFPLAAVIGFKIGAFEGACRRPNNLPSPVSCRHEVESVAS